MSSDWEDDVSWCGRVWRTGVRGVLRFSNNCADRWMLTRTFKKTSLEVNYRVWKLSQIGRHLNSEPVGKPTNSSCGTDCFDYNPLLAWHLTALSHVKLFEQTWHAAHLSMKKRTDGAVPCICCRFGNKSCENPRVTATRMSARMWQPRDEFTRNFSVQSSAELCCHITIFWSLLKSYKSDGRCVETCVHFCSYLERKLRFNHRAKNISDIS